MLNSMLNSMFNSMLVCLIVCCGVTIAVSCVCQACGVEHSRMTSTCNQPTNQPALGGYYHTSVLLLILLQIVCYYGVYWLYRGDNGCGRRTTFFFLPRSSPILLQRLVLLSWGFAYPGPGVTNSFIPVVATITSIIWGTQRNMYTYRDQLLGLPACKKLPGRLPTTWSVTN